MTARTVIPINEATTRHLRQLLKDKRASLRKALGHLDEISIVRAADVLDALQLSQERSLAIESLDLRSYAHYNANAPRIVRVMSRSLAYTD